MATKLHKQLRLLKQLKEAKAILLISKKEQFTSVLAMALTKDIISYMQQEINKLEKQLKWH